MYMGRGGHLAVYLDWRTKVLRGGAGSCWPNPADQEALQHSTRQLSWLLSEDPRRETIQNDNARRDEEEVNNVRIGVESGAVVAMGAGEGVDV